MTLQIKDRIRETSTTTGTGTYTLAGAVTGFLPFSGISDGDTTYYLAERNGQWEVGLGTVGGSGTTLARTTVIKSSNSDAAVNWGSGTKQIAAVVPAALLSVLAEVSGGTLAEYVRDTIGTALTGGDNITVTPNDGGDTITVAVTAMTASRAVVTDGSGNLSVSAVTATELGYVSGVTSNLQAQITALQALTIRQPKVIARVDNTAAPPTEVSGNRYLLDATGSSHADWDGAAANSIVEFDGTSWVETVPAEGWVVYNDDTDTDWLAVNDGTLSWQERSTSVTSLNGLLDVVISSPAAGEYLRYNGSGWVNAEILAADISDPENLSITASQVSDFSEAVDDRVDALLVEGSGISLTYDDGAGTLTITATSVGSGEANTASNVGASGIGVFHQKSGVDLQLRKLVGGDTNTIDVTLNSNVVEFDLDAGLADLNDVDDSLSGAAGNILYHDADDWTDLPIGTAGQILQVNSGADAPEWADISSLTLSHWNEANASPVANEITSWAPSSGSSNVDAVVSPKGTGAFALNVADGTASGGNDRGQYAIDLQTFRSAATEVASGFGSFVAGYTSTASGTGSVAIGVGIVSTASAVAIGNNSTADAEYAMALGRHAHTHGIEGVLVHAGGRLSVTGDAQTGLDYPLRVQTTDATLTTLTTDGGAAGTNNQIVLRDDSLIAVDALIIGRRTNGSGSAAYRLFGLFERGTGAASVARIGALHSDASESGTGWTVTAVADTTNGAIAFRVTGASGHSIDWYGAVRTAEVG